MTRGKHIDTKQLFISIATVESQESDFALG